MGAIVFYEAIHWSSYLFLQLGAGYRPPAPLGEGRPVVTEISRRWICSRCWAWVAAGCN